MPDEIDLPLAPPAKTVDPATLEKFFTADDLAKAREQEKSKLYPEIERYKSELKAIKEAEQERANAAAAQEAAEAADARRRAESEMDLRTLLEQKEQDWAAQLEAEKTARENAFAMLEQERKYNELVTYLNQRMDAERDNIMPELQDLVTGNSVEEIEASIETMKERTARIVTSVQSATQAARQGMAGTRVTAPATGPLDTNSENRSFTPEQIKGMSAADYAKNRTRLLGGASSNSGRGIFG